MDPRNSLVSLAALTGGKSRSISPENRTGEPGRGGAATTGTGAAAARDLGTGWKVSPSFELPAGATEDLAAIDGPGIIRHLWLTTHTDHWRRLVLRIYWEDSDVPAVETPVGDFFCQGWGEFAQVSSVPVAVNPHGGFNCYWDMPFRDRARVTLTNIGAEPAIVYYQVDYELTEVPADTGYLHAAWRRSNPLPYGEVHTLLSGVTGPGHYVGSYLAWGVNSSGWWGEGEIKFYLDGDREYPTICGTGTEDYFGGAWNFDVPGQGYTAYSTPYLGLPQVIRPDGLYRSQQRFGMYRWHIQDPIRFSDELRVTIQALGWRSGGRYLPLRDDISSTAWWYQQDPAGLPGPELSADDLEIA
ncbi:MAG: glycoside hydrolase family 172 protein [Actinocatenispora sp.]